MKKTNKCNGCKYASEHQEMGFRPFGVCTKTTNLIEAVKAYNSETCSYESELKEKLKIINLDKFIKKEPEIEKLITKEINEDGVIYKATLDIQKHIDKTVLSVLNAFVKDINEELYQTSRIYLEAVSKDTKDYDSMDKYGVMTIAHDIVMKIAEKYGVEFK